MGEPVKPATAKINWHRVRRELARVEERRARERAERERRFATDPRRNMPSRFPKGEYGPPLADDCRSEHRRLNAPDEPSERQAELGLPRSTAGGVA